MIVHFHYVAQPTHDQGRGPPCAALARTGPCPNGARWSLRGDDRRAYLVCRMHANKAETSNGLEMVEARTR